MTRVFLSIYYLLLSANIIVEARRILFQNFTHKTDFIWLATVFNYIPISDFAITIIYFVTFFLSVFCIMKPNLLIRILTSLFVILCYSLLFSFGKIPHSNHLWLISSFLICFIDPNKELVSKKNVNVILIIRTVLLTHYISSGLWKLRNLEQFNINYFSDIALGNIAFAQLEGSTSVDIIRVFFQESPIISGVSFILVILLQLSCVVPIFTKKYNILYGIGVTCFHFLNGLILGIWFHPTVVGMLFFFVLTEIMFQTNLELNSATQS